MRKLKQKHIQVISYVLISFAVIAGAFYGGVLYEKSTRPSVQNVLGVDHTETTVSTNADFEPFWKAWNLITEKSPSVKDISDQDRVYGAIQGLMGSLNDPYSVFFPPQESKLFEETVAGEFGGIGAEVGIKENILTVISPIKDTPAYRAGIKSGDKILKIDDTDTNGMTIDKAISIIRGEKGTSVALEIYREGDDATQTITIVRDTIAIPTLETKLRDDEIFVISIYNFSANMPALFRTALKEFTDANTDKLIIDLRGNPGGYLEAAIDMVSWFLPSGKTIVIEDFGEKAEKEIHRSRGYDVFTDKLKIVVLVDQGSASASEIVAGALQDNDRATLVGQKTYGKGSVQELIQVSKDTSLKITVANWLTPNGVWISKQGITPDVVVPITKEDVESERDPQMDKAVELLNK